MMEYSIQDIWAIKRALTTPKPWDCPELYDIKKRIKKYLIVKQHEQCCYCQKNITGEFLLVLDIEHILPKSIFTHCNFDLLNLAISCKRCNMHIKRDRVDFLSSIPETTKNLKHKLFFSEFYSFIHPNLDDYRYHLTIESRHNSKYNYKLIKYNIESEKGRFTYEYFKLKELEVNSIDNAQREKKYDINDESYQAVKYLERQHRT